MTNWVQLPLFPKATIYLLWIINVLATPLPGPLPLPRVLSFIFYCRSRTEQKEQKSRPNLGSIYQKERAFLSVMLIRYTPRQCFLSRPTLAYLKKHCQHSLWVEQQGQLIFFHHHKDWSPYFLLVDGSLGPVRETTQVALFGLGVASKNRTWKRWKSSSCSKPFN